MYQGIVSQLIQQPGDKLTEAKNGLATLVRVYCCAVSYASTARSTLVPGYSPSDYPYMALLTAPEETVTNGIASFNCTFYGVLSTDKYNQPYDYVETQVSTATMNYIDLLATDPAKGTSYQVHDSFTYLSPILIRSYVRPKTQDLTPLVPTFSNFNGFPFNEFNSVVTYDAGVNQSAVRLMDANTFVSKTGGYITPTRSTITDYGCVRQIEVAYAMTVPQHPFSIGAGTLSGRSVYYPIDSANYGHLTDVSAPTISATHDDYSTMDKYTDGARTTPNVPVSISFNPVTYSDEFPIIGYDISWAYYAGDSDPRTATTVIEKIIDATSQGSSYTLPSGNIFTGATGHEIGIYDIQVSPVSPYETFIQGSSTGRIRFSQPGPPLPPSIVSISQPTQANPYLDIQGSGSDPFGGNTQIPGPSIIITFNSPLWDGYSTDNTVSGKVSGITSINVKVEAVGKTPVVTNYSFSYSANVQTITVGALPGSIAGTYLDSWATVQSVSATGTSIWVGGA